ncbi:DNA-binding CsgD family transcriptional regulator [Nonomuraea thailandensis]|uniref:DNA-binding CsgD family transcriptional regulator n=1 Tax=Nonomuraea thailandensis TaxID=1188745 RepID=A0A9X2K4Z9_9ACTN|nr:helix-turn-helix transcriptional regulator [Nonomuraea thailandensis]MCP2360563.1 DNA-binding CsgD family transcriptional regulator [Nonomuraea thailandensis]
MSSDKPLLRGRGEAERALLRLLDHARDGSGGALLLAGAPGMGKTALLDLAVAHAGPRFRVLRVSGVESESRLPYAGLHGLLRPVAAGAASLPGAQARALMAALESGTGAGGLALPAAVLGLLSAVAAERPVLACVDDVDLLDAGSRQALSFVARRVSGEPVALLFTAREGERAPEGARRTPHEPEGVPAQALDGLDGVPVQTLGRLDAAAVRELAGDLAAGKVAEDLLAALDQIAHGNPLALAELIGSLTPDQLAGLAAPPVTLPRGGRLWREHTSRLAALPAQAQRLLLLIAADPGLDLPTLIRAARPSCALTALEPAERAGVLHSTGDRYDFRDPAMRGVVYYGASLLRRRSAHRLLATLLSADERAGERTDGRAGERTDERADERADESQGLRRAWHRACALDGLPASLADDLAAAALDAHPAHTHPEPYLALERAAELTDPHDPAKAERLAAAARYAWVAGRPQVARSLLARLRNPTAPDELRAHVQLLHGSLELLGGETGNAREELLSAATWLLESHRMLGVRALVRAADASYRAGDNRAFIAIARQAAALRRPDEAVPTQLMFEYLAGMASTFSGSHQEAAAPLRRVVELAGSVRDPSVLVWACVASMLLGEDATAHRLSARAVEAARVRGAVSAMPQLLEYTIYPEIWMGRYAAVATTAAQGLRLAQETGQLNTAAQHLAWLAITAAVEGDQETCRVRADAAIGLADAHDLGIAGAIGNWALAYLDLAAGRPADAANRLRAERRNSNHVVIRVMATPHFIEACARTGDQEAAGAALRVLERWVGSTRSPDLRALVSRCRALLAGPGESEELFREALDLHGQGVYEFEAARTRLLYGSALRRDRRPGAARTHLHAALETFERYDARLWTEQARTELRASGDPVRPVLDVTTGQLTAQQLQIARMVAEGATNKEVAEQLFLSRRTVEHHLRNIFSRLGIRSRVELVRLMS